jgi:hypothetical protein
MPENKNWFDLFVNQTTDAVTEPQFAQILDFGIFASGEFDGATVKIQISPDDVMNTDLYPTPDDAEWFDHNEAMFTDKTYVNGDLSEAWFRGVVENAGGATNVSLKMRPRVEASI